MMIFVHPKDMRNNNISSPRNYNSVSVLFFNYLATIIYHPSLKSGCDGAYFFVISMNLKRLHINDYASSLYLCKMPRSF